MGDRLTREQAAILSAYTGVLLGPFEDMQAYIERILGRAVWTHELASDDVCEEIREKAKPDLARIIAERGATTPTGAGRADG
jgi:hypothetical protein